jgi:hypothetical protein
MRTIISLQSNFMADGRDELPGLTALDRFSKGIGFGVEKR